MNHSYTLHSCARLHGHLAYCDDIYIFVIYIHVENGDNGAFYLTGRIKFYLRAGPVIKCNDH